MKLHAWMEGGTNLHCRLYDEDRQGYLTGPVGSGEDLERAIQDLLIGHDPDLRLMLERWIELASVDGTHALVGKDPGRPWLDESPWRKPPLLRDMEGATALERYTCQLLEVLAELRRLVHKKRLIERAPASTRELLTGAGIVDALLAKGWTFAKASYGTRYHPNECGFSSATDFKKKMKSLRRAWRGEIKLQITDEGPTGSVCVTFTTL